MKNVLKVNRNCENYFIVKTKKNEKIAIQIQYQPILLTQYSLTDIIYLDYVRLIPNLTKKITCLERIRKCKL